MNTHGQLPWEAPSEPDSGVGEVLPAGRYKIFIESFQIKETKARDGSYAEIVMLVQDAEHNGRKLWARYTLQNPNAQAVSIGKRQLGELSFACGNTEPLTNLNQLLNKTCMVDVEVRKPEGYSPQNDVKKAHPIDGAAPSQQSTSSAAAPSAPWEQ